MAGIVINFVSSADFHNVACVHHSHAVCNVCHNAQIVGAVSYTHLDVYKRQLLALIRDKVFGALRRLTPAKLEGRDRGDLISLITADIDVYKRQV